MKKLTPINQQTTIPAREVVIETKEFQPQSQEKSMPQSKFKSAIYKAIGALVVVVAGTVSGFGLSEVVGGSTSTNESSSSQTITTTDQVNAGDIIGAQDETGCKDKATGVLQLGGMEGEGSHHLVRPGGEIKNVYLTSSVVDLGLVVDHEVEVCGETFSAQKAGWLMDVVRVQVLTLNAPLPQ